MLSVPSPDWVFQLRLLGTSAFSVFSVLDGKKQGLPYGAPPSPGTPSRTPQPRDSLLHPSPLPARSAFPTAASLSGSPSPHVPLRVAGIGSYKECCGREHSP